MSLLDTINFLKSGAARMLADDDEFDAYTPVGLDGVLAATEKLLAVNRGLEDPDERDSLTNDRTYTTDMLLAEKIRMDKDQLRKKVMWHASRHRTLKGLHPFAFDRYGIGMISGSQLSQPLEEINPLHIAEQARRMTKMGPGGVGDPMAVTAGMNAVHTSQFGFVDPVAGPECFDDRSEVYTQRGWVPWPQVEDGDVFACRVDGRLEWHAASRIVRAPYKGKMIVAESKSFRVCVTPNHRVVFKRDCETRSESILPAEDLYGRTIFLPVRHLPMLGDESCTVFQLPSVPKTNSNQKLFGPFNIVDWCSLMGWWLSEGSSSSWQTVSSGGTPYFQKFLSISQCPVANPENHALIAALLVRMGLNSGGCKKRRGFCFRGKQLTEYFSKWSSGCYDKWVPEDLQIAPLVARQALLDALIRGDGRDNGSHLNYCTVSKRLADSVERLAFGLGYAAYIRVEPDKRAHVKTTNYVVVLGRAKHRLVRSKSYKKGTNTCTGNNWRQEDYDGMVYCATVPGGQLHVRGKLGSGFWSGNSNLAGLDVRLAHGVRIGSDRRLYQRFKNRSSGKIHWMSPEDLLGAAIKIPD